MTTTTNDKYEITDIAHEQYPFLHRIRALREIGAEVKTGDLGGFVESESNLSFEPDDDAWIFDDAIACNTAYVDKGSQLRKDAIACHDAYVSHGTVMTENARAEDRSYIRGACLGEQSRVSGCGMVLHDAETLAAPILSGQAVVYGRVSGNVRLTGTAVVFSNEEIRHDWPDTLMLDGQIRSIIRENSRDELKPSQGQAKDVPGKEEKARKRGISR